MQWVITTDMDGTLLNHDDYRWQAARPVLDFLQQVHIPVILNTSKTLSEVKDWIERLAIDHPFIIENGSAIYCPKGYFKSSDAIRNTGRSHQTVYDVIQLGESIDRLLEFKRRHAPDIESLVECSLGRAIEMTGLTREDAKAAQDRRYTVPLFTDDKDNLLLLEGKARDEGFQIVSGGRFSHLMGTCEKGRAIQHLCRLYEQQQDSDIGLIALGDSNNDRAMLEVADHPIVIRNHHDGWLDMPGERIYRTSQQAPEGWVEGIVQVLGTEFTKLKELT